MAYTSRDRYVTRGLVSENQEFGLVDIVLTEISNATVAGRVINTSGNPIANALVELVELNNGVTKPINHTYTSSDGLFVLSFPNGTYTDIYLIASSTTSISVSDDFSTDSGLWVYQGSAYRDKNHQYLVLTENKNSQEGVVWLNRTISLPFNVSFKYKASAGIVGADGIVFMFCKDKNYLPRDGGELGFNGGNGYGVEFDSYFFNPGDPLCQHIALIKNTARNHLLYVCNNEVNDNHWHNVNIKVTANSVDVLLDGSNVLNYTGTIDSTFNNLGISASTGALKNWHIIDDFKLTFN